MLLVLAAKTFYYAMDKREAWLDFFSDKYYEMQMPCLWVFDW